MIVKLKKQRRKLQHITLLRVRIAELHDNIFQRALSGKKPEKIEAMLLLKYNRRLKLILY
jgi:hypothetical protein